MPKFIVPDNYTNKSWVRKHSRIIKKSKADQMRSRFGDAYSFPFEIPGYLKFIQALENIKAELRTNEKLGLGLIPGRKQPEDKYFNLALVPVIYQQASDEIPKTDLRYPEKFFGRMNPTFEIEYEDEVGESKINGATRVKDEIKGLRTDIVIIEYDILKEFSGLEADYLPRGRMLFEFARNSKSRLTMILSRRYYNGDVIQSTASGDIGVFLDDHDLLP